MPVRPRPRPHRPAPRRWAVTLLALLAATAAGCTDPDEPAQVSTGGPTTTEDTTATTAPATTTAPTTTATPTSTAAPTTTAPPTTPPTDPCATGGGATGGGASGDVDGDGTADTVLVAGGQLVACTADGTYRLDLPGADDVALVDLDGDGAAEILAGGTAATSRTVQVLRLRDGALVAVSGPGGPLALTDGYPEATPPDGPRHAFGCGGTVDGVAVHLITLEVIPLSAADRAYSFSATGWLLDGTTASVVATESATTPAGTPGGTPEELVALANEIVAQHAPPC